MALRLLATASVAGARIQSGKEKDSMFADIAKVFFTHCQNNLAQAVRLQKGTALIVSEPE